MKAALLTVLLAWASTAEAAAACNGDNADAERILKCIKQLLRKVSDVIDAFSFI